MHNLWETSTCSDNYVNLFLVTMVKVSGIDTDRTIVILSKRNTSGASLLDSDVTTGIVMSERMSGCSGFYEKSEL